MLRILTPDLKLIPEGKILPFESYAVYEEAQGIILAAQKQAQHIIEDAQNIYESEKKRGFQEGKAESEIAVSEKMVDYVTRIGANLERFEVKLVEMLMQALKQIIGNIDRETLITGVVNKSLQVVRSQKRITIRVCPSDLAFVESQINTYLEKYPTIQFLDVTPDDRLNAGDCILETDVGVVDGRLNQQLAVIQQSIERWLK